MRAARIALVSNDEQRRRRFQALLAEAGYQLAASFDAERLLALLSIPEGQLGAHRDQDVDSWLLDTGDGGDDLLPVIVENSAASLLVCDDMPLEQGGQSYQRWLRRLLEKLEENAVYSESQDDTVPPSVASKVERIWVLAASVGGPEMVKRFLAALPAGLPLAMVYAQHIDRSFDDFLVAGVGQQKSYRLQLARGEQQLVEGQVLVVPADHQLRFLPFGRVVETRRCWQGVYSPALDQVIAELARLYRERLGVIVFSGMCNDSEIGCRVVKSCGGRVWVQSPLSCVVPAMPEAVIATGCVDYQGSPEQLALKLAAEIRMAAET